MRLVMMVLALVCLSGQARADDCGDLVLVERIEGAYAVLEGANGRMWSQRMTESQRRVWREGTRVRGGAECATKLKDQVQQALKRLRRE